MHQAADAPALRAALNEHGLALLVFFVRRVLEAEFGIALWAEAVAQAHLADRRLGARSTAEAVGWLDAMAYRQLARYRATGRTEDRALRLLGARAPAPEVALRLGVCEDVVRSSVSSALRLAAQSHAPPDADAMRRLVSLHEWLASAAALSSAAA